MERKIQNSVRGKDTIDGAGVKLTRVLGPWSMREFDPILMLDSFDSTNYDDYKASFPMHPHRGIETISYIYKGAMTHKDSLGNSDTINDGEVQWMCAGSGIMHEEILPKSPRLLGVQLWLNLPKKDKMCDPFYKAIKNDEIKELDLENAKLRILAGEYESLKAYESKNLSLDYYDIHLKADKTQKIFTKKDRFVMLFTLIGDVFVGQDLVKEKTAVKLSEGEFVNLKAKTNAQILLMSSTPLNEPCEWGGPIVMNTKEELQIAFSELGNNTFIKNKTKY